jgi:RNA polymerase sigma factor (sigma-70 family)
MTPNDLTREQLETMQRVAERVARYYARNANDKEDFEQVICLKILRRLDAFDAERGTFDLWCGMVAKSEIKNHFTSNNASKRRTLHTATSIDAPLIEDGSSISEFLADNRTGGLPFENETVNKMLGDIFEHLSKAERLAFALVCCAQLDYEQVIDIINDAKISKHKVTYRTVDNAVQRARKKLSLVFKQ